MKKIIFALCVIVTLTVFIGLVFRHISTSASIQVSITTAQSTPQKAATTRATQTRSTTLTGRMIGATMFSMSIIAIIIVYARELKSRQKKSDLRFNYDNRTHSPLL